jgi:hypothetical protein
MPLCSSLCHHRAHSELALACCNPRRRLRRGRPSFKHVPQSRSAVTVQARSSVTFLSHRISCETVVAENLHLILRIYIPLPLLSVSFPTVEPSLPIANAHRVTHAPPRTPFAHPSSMESTSSASPAPLLPPRLSSPPRLPSRLRPL